jgi:hypothetical protein
MPEPSLDGVKAKRDRADHDLAGGGHRSNSRKRGLLSPARPRYNTLAWAPTSMAGFALSTYGRF